MSEQKEKGKFILKKREDDAYLVTGNQKHYPIRDFIVTPAEMMEIINICRGSWQATEMIVIVTGLIATFAAVQEGRYIRTGREIE